MQYRARVDVKFDNNVIIDLKAPAGPRVLPITDGQFDVLAFREGTFYLLDTHSALYRQDGFISSAMSAVNESGKQLWQRFYMPDPNAERRSGDGPQASIDGEWFDMVLDGRLYRYRLARRPPEQQPLLLSMTFTPIGWAGEVRLIETQSDPKRIAFLELGESLARVRYVPMADSGDWFPGNSSYDAPSVPTNPYAIRGFNDRIAILSVSGESAYQTDFRYDPYSPCTPLVTTVSAILACGGVIHGFTP